MRSSELWDVQWHPATGSKVRKVTLTGKGLRWAVAGIVTAASLLVVGTLTVVPFGLRSAFQRFTFDEITAENRALRDENEALFETASRLSRRVLHAEQRCRRLAWTIAGPEELWHVPGPPPPQDEHDEEALVGWLDSRSARLVVLAQELSALEGGHRCPLVDLPTAPPVDLNRAVPVALFGWRVSPFTGKEEAHHGVTIAAPAGEAVWAPGGGTVAYAGRVRERLSNEWTRLGAIVVIDHGCNVFTVLGHLGEVRVRRGQRVGRGDAVATVGESGWTTAPALYMEVRWPLGQGSAPIDPALVSIELPLERLEARLADPTGGLPEGYARLERIVRRR